jgi:hypothetical protein
MVQKVLRNFFQLFWKGLLEWYDRGGENGITLKRILKLKHLSPLKMLTSPLFQETFGAFLFLFLSLSFFSFVSQGHRDFDDI